MDENRNLAQIQKEISSKILDSIYLTDVLSDLTDGEAKFCTIVNHIKNNLQISFKDIEQCRKMISIPE